VEAAQDGAERGGAALAGEWAGRRVDFAVEDADGFGGELLGPELAAEFADALRDPRLMAAWLQVERLEDGRDGGTLRPFAFGRFCASW
jgi:hypothetical protein